jgi:glycosyltransferase involved in cell wall biosynthesis
MTFCIITHVNHYQEQNEFFAYAPYVREMNIWLQYVDAVIIVAPLEKSNKTPIDSAYSHDKIIFKPVADFNITGVKQLFKTVFALPQLFYTVYKAMQASDHIHLRCPGNMGLIGCIVQIFFPKKKKTAKYAGNWDLNAPQPWSYRLQKWILNNTMLTKNMQVLVYGKWEGSSPNIKPFFTATYSESEKTPIQQRDLNETIRFLFVGALAEGKRPVYALQLVEELVKNGKNVSLQFFGEGNQRQLVEEYIATNHLEAFVTLEGNQTKEVVLEAYKKAHFLILASKSEGWPKVVAEAMFWGCVPLASIVSCVPTMLDNGERGILLELDIDKDGEQVASLISNPILFYEMAEKAAAWSRLYTLEKFESEIKALL